MGEVYRARDTRLDRDVAVKVLPAELSEDETYRKRLEREGKTISQLQHPNLCTVYDVGCDANPKSTTFVFASVTVTSAGSLKKSGPTVPQV